MTLEDFKLTDWYKERPQIIKDAIEKLPPIQLYKFKNSGHQCRIYSYSEPSEEYPEVTVTVQKTGVGCVFPELSQYQVFGVKMDDLEPWIDPYLTENIPT